MSTHVPALPMPPKLAHISSTPSTRLSHFATLWREGHRQAARDFRTRWRRCGLWLFLVAWMVMLLIGLTWLSSPNSDLFGELEACLPDGSFAMDSSHFRYLSGLGFFQITMGWGHMTFTQAKAIDVIWDIVSCHT
jgi:hypothetical protein